MNMMSRIKIMILGPDSFISRASPCQRKVPLGLPSRLLVVVETESILKRMERSTHVVHKIREWM